MHWPFNPLGGKTINRRAVCGRSARTVRRGEGSNPIGPSYPYQIHDPFGNTSGSVRRFDMALEDHLLTESRNERSEAIDDLSALEIVQLMSAEDGKVVEA